ncbi:hypothetical protein GQ607_014282 [Colletotrichum asianum]|uniref:Uncharacterized protein n=1 Tax=Colletotrichum asianum TaxID=702518 RepID=A0A8H3ZG56_9PEZI|nr:hypothetical protein GQ607_014282 [Colletotrichum asianum]
MAAFVSHHLPLLFSLHLPRPSAFNPARRVACLPVACLHSSPSHPSSHCRILAQCELSRAEHSSKQRELRTAVTTNHHTTPFFTSLGQTLDHHTAKSSSACPRALALSTHQPRHNLTCHTLFPLLQLRRLSLVLHPNGPRLVCLSAATLTCPAASSAAAAACHLASIVYPPPTARLTPCFA